MFSHLVGNTHIKGYLSRMLNKGSYANSFLFAGPDGVGKSLFALTFAKGVLGISGSERISHPDLHFYHPEGKTGMHSIQSMREFGDEVYLPPMEGTHKVFIIQDADRMLPYSANALLKTFEEPSSDAIIILVSSRPSRLLPTILSRCQKIFFHALGDDEILQLLREKQGLDDAAIHSVVSLAQGSVGSVCRLLDHTSQEMRRQLLEVLAKGSFASFKQLTDLAQHLSKTVEALTEEKAASLRESLTKGFTEKLSATQKEALEKEVDGAASIQLLENVQFIFDVIISWFRDLSLLRVQGNESLLINRDYRDLLLASYQRGSVKSVEQIQTIINDVKLLLERSTSLSICLEHLFIRL